MAQTQLRKLELFLLNDLVWSTDSLCANSYADGEIVREGSAGDHGDGAFSSGRGGIANIGSPGLKATKRNDSEIIPEVAIRPSSAGRPEHIGRGGAGNIDKGKPVTSAAPTGLADKLKMKLFRSKKSEKTTTTT